MRVGEHDLDLDRGVLSHDGTPVHLRAKTYRLLCHLACNSGRVISKDELLANVWPEVSVTEDSLTQAISDLRRVLGPTAVKTVNRRGYMLDLAVNGTSQVAVSVATVPPVIVVLPMQTVSDMPATAALVDGLVEEVIQRLGRYGLVQVIARHSAFQCRPETIAPRSAAERLGAEWFVEGTARETGGTIRLALALCEAASGRQVWAEGFSLDPTGLDAMIGVIAHRIVTRVILDTERRIVKPLTAHGTASLTTWQHFIAGVAAIRSYGEGVNERAREHFCAAIARDPDFALAHAYLGLTVLTIGRYDLSPPEVLDAGLRHALRGVEMAPDEARCHSMLALARLWRREFAAAEIAMRRALELNPSDADLMSMFGYVLTSRGRAEEGIAWIEAAIRLNPLHPDWYHCDLGCAMQLAGRHAEAIAQMLCLPVVTAWRHTRIAACCAALGDARGARRHLAAASALDPGWDPLLEAERWHELERIEDHAQMVADVAAAVRMASVG